MNPLPLSSARKRRRQRKHAVSPRVQKYLEAFAKEPPVKDWRRKQTKVDLVGKEIIKRGKPRRRIMGVWI